MRISDTLTRQVIDFTPRTAGAVQMFVCGPTVYDDSHLGHARTYVAFDMVARYLRHRGFTVRYVQNITDIDDKIINRANELGVAAKALADKFTSEYFDDMRALNILSVDKYAPATDYMEAIIRQIQTLLDKGFAYVAPDGSVYYEVRKFAEYGKLSGRTNDEDNQSRVEHDEAKRDPRDFALWKAHKPGEPAWDSPWGKGRPGWHIEDTAITETEFGTQYDLHGGGKDLEFPHHECEIAQMEAASGQAPLVRHWLHSGFLQIDSSKMSKSLGNFLTIKAALKVTSANVLRLMFLRTYYRSPIDYTEELVQETKSSWERIQLAIRNADRVLAATPCPENAAVDHPLVLATDAARARFAEAMDNDFGTPDALAVVFELVSELNRQLASVERASSPGDIAAVCVARDGVEGLLEVLGFAEIRGRAVQSSELAGQLVDLLIELRQQARGAKRYQDADAIRQRLADLNVVLEDNKSGTSWRLRE